MNPSSKLRPDTSRRDFLFAVGGAAALPLLNAYAALPGAESNPQRPKNVIFILSDDHRYDFMGFMGTPEFLQTPNMDRMAREGLHLQNAFVSTSLCSPSRASILTGQYAHKHGVVDNNSRVPAGTTFFPQLLQKKGYETAFMGKWHMGHNSDEPRPGFDKWISFTGQGVYFDPELNIDGQKVFAQGYISDILTDHALQWLQKDRDKPFFLYLSHKAVHAMFKPAPRHLGKYENDPLKYPASMADTPENYKDKPDWVKQQRNSWHGVDYMYHGDMDYDTFYRRYCETLLGIDDSIGRILDYLDQHQLSESTLVMYMGDNGFCFGEHGLIDKRHMYEESMRVPLLACAPGMIKPGSTIKQMIQNIDIAPTILDLAGITTPENMDGLSFLPLLQGREVPWRDAVFYEYYWERNFPQTPTVHGIRTDRYKYIHYHGIWDIDELYDLQNDPQEMHNLINNPEYKNLIESLNQRMFDWLEKTGGMLIPLRRDTGFRAIKRKTGK
ncbi:MAG: sulfatase [Sedimentisphaerales bacterium]|nr:sulfatase [Sedimentisphaerales bacterium]